MARCTSPKSYLSSRCIQTDLLLPNTGPHMSRTFVSGSPWGSQHRRVYSSAFLLVKYNVMLWTCIAVVSYWYFGKIFVYVKSGLFILLAICTSGKKCQGLFTDYGDCMLSPCYVKHINPTGVASWPGDFQNFWHCFRRFSRNVYSTTVI